MGESRVAGVVVGNGIKTGNCSRIGVRDGTGDSTSGDCVGIGTGTSGAPSLTVASGNGVTVG